MNPEEELARRLAQAEEDARLARVTKAKEAELALRLAEEAEQARMLDEGGHE